MNSASPVSTHHIDRLLALIGLLTAALLTLPTLLGLKVPPLGAVTATIAAASVLVAAMRHRLHRTTLTPAAISHLASAAGAALIIGFTLLLFHPVLHSWLLADDLFFVTEFHHADAAARLAWWLPPRGDSVQILRPIAHLTTWAILEYFGVDAFALHFANILIHALSAVAVACIAGRATGRGWLALAAGIGFAAQPLAPTSVGWLNTHQDPLATLFALLSLIALFAAADGYRAAPFLAAGAFAMALLSKESPAGLPLAGAALLFLFDRQSGDRWSSRMVRLLARLTPMVAVLFAYIGARFALFGGLGGYQGEHAPAVLSLGHAVLKKLLLYLPETLLLAVNQAILSNPHALHAGAAALAIVVLSRLPAARNDGRGLRLFAIGIALAIAGVAPIHNMAWIGPELLNARYLYLASAGIVLAITGALAEIADRRRLSTIATVSLTLTWLSFYTVVAVANRDQWLANASITSGIADDLRALDRAHPIVRAEFVGFPPFHRGSYIFHLDRIPELVLARPIKTTTTAAAPTQIAPIGTARYLWLGGERLFMRARWHSHDPSAVDP